jgi:hypothetical protein
LTNWRSQRFEYDANDNIIYIGRHKTPNAGTSSGGWYIEKLTYDSANNPTRVQGPEIGVWDKRTDLF